RSGRSCAVNVVAAEHAVVEPDRAAVVVNSAASASAAAVASQVRYRVLREGAIVQCQRAAAVVNAAPVDLAAQVLFHGIVSECAVIEGQRAGVIDAAARRVAVVAVGD